MDDDKVNFAELLQRVPTESWYALFVYILYTAFLALNVYMARAFTSYFPLYIARVLREFIATFSYCACLYGDEILLHYFGYIGLFAGILLHFSVFQRLNKRNGENLLIIGEEVLRMNIYVLDYGLVIVAQISAAFCSRYYALLILDTTLVPVSEICHLKHLFYENDALQPILIIVVLLEFLGGAALHMILRQFQKRIETIAFFYALIFTISHYAVGVFAPHPMIFMSRYAYCSVDMVTEEALLAFLVHNLVPLIGWMFVPIVTRKPTTLRSVWGQRFEEMEEKSQAPQGGNNKKRR
ncbi:hypothetical protein GCK72_004774 [Caenorhabditis remanei]|uniref:Uncharacterized protein n=1 Tax=Caenorhabditis remanei TaxID=31234 RepID=A0A6A5HD88_CAERE|nr:hypothetical protein GCK72_004774 [Caenorhabditis remanei]KAF1764824.1 hypothetical protein GCK72_004774 [Caenorhabditis remanei]